MTTAYERLCLRLEEVTGYRPPHLNGHATWRCPAHDDRNPSLSVSQGSDRVLVRCGAGCETSRVVEMLGMTMGDLFDEARKPEEKPRIVASYAYVDEAGNLLYEVVRRDPKSFSQRRPDGHGGWTWSLGDTRRPLYRLPAVGQAVAEGRPIWICEGEKDVAALERAGRVATCNSGGAGSWLPEHGATLAGASHVVIVRDKDAAGIKHAADVEASLIGRVGRITVVEAKDDFKDAAEHLGAGYGIEDFVKVSDTKEPTEPGESPFIDWSTFWDKDRREPEWAYEDVLARGRGHALFAKHKQGKSLFTLWLTLQLIDAGTAVLYLDYEMGEDDLYERLQDMGRGPHADLSLLHYALLPSLPPLDTADGARALHDLVDHVQQPGRHTAVIIDTIGRAVQGDENPSDTIRDFYRHTGIGLKRRGVTWARLDHAGKDDTKGQRGSSAKGDDVDIVWKLTRTEHGINLKREASRVGWVPEQVSYQILTDPLRYIPVAEGWPAGTADVARALDTLGIPTDASYRTAGQMLREANQGRSTDLVRAAQKWRRQNSEQPR